MGKKQLLVSLFLSMLLLSNIVLAQTDILGTITSFLTSKDMVGILFIIAFVVVLLLVAGIRPKFKGGFSLGLIAFLILIVLLFVLPQIAPFPTYLAVPESFKVYALPSGSDTALQLIGLPADWAFIPAILYLFILPFAGIYTLVWAFLVTLGIFSQLQSSINRILSLVITFMTIPTGIFVKMVWILFSFMGAWSVAIFAATFIAGLFFRGAGIVAKEQSAYKKLVDVRKGRLRDAIAVFEQLQSADLVTIQRDVPPALTRFSDVITANAEQNLLQATRQTEPGNAQAFIRQAVNEMKRQL